MAIWNHTSLSHKAQNPQWRELLSSVIGSNTFLRQRWSRIVGGHWRLGSGLDRLDPESGIETRGQTESAACFLYSL